MNVLPSRARLACGVAATATLGLLLNACGSDASHPPHAAAMAAVAHAGTPSPTGHGSGHDVEDDLAGLLGHQPGASGHPAEQSTGPKRDIAQIRRVIIDHYADPGCGELTDNAERQFGYGPGPDCDRIIDERNTSRKVEVGAVHVHGDEATAQVEDETFLMVRQDKKWLIDGVR